MFPKLSTFCFRRWHSRQDVAERPLFGFSTGLLPLILIPSKTDFMEGLAYVLENKGNPFS